ncbi:MAG: tetratricopeptide repeat protein [Bacteroidota bacterium]
MKSPYVTVALAFALAFAVLDAAGYFFPGSMNWGYHFIGFLPPIYAIVLFMVGIAGVTAALNRDIQPWIMRGQMWMNNKPYEFLIVTVVLFITAATIFRITVPLLGDGFYIVKHYADVSRGDAPLDPRNEPLATFLFYTFMNILGKPGYHTLLDGFFYGEMLLGVVFLLTSYVIVKNLLNDSQPRLLAFIFLATLPYMQLYFGYVENYSLVLTLLALYIASAVLIYRDKIPFYAAAVLFILNFSAHYLTLLLFPSFIYLMYCCYQRKKYRDVLIGDAIILSSVGLLVILVGGDVARLIPSAPYHHYLSLSKPKETLEQASQAYILLSPYHVLDLLNYALLMTPAIFALIGMRIVQKENYLSGPRNKEHKFLGIALIPIILFLFVVKFDLGAARDWDVIAPYFFIAAILALSMFYEYPVTGGEKAITIILLISVVQSMLMFSLNSTSEASIKRYKSLFDRRNTSQNAYYNGSLYLAYYYHQVNNTDGAITVWKDYSNAFPPDERAYANILTNVGNLENPSMDIILATYKRWLALNPDNAGLKKEFADLLNNAGNACFEKEKLREAAAFYLEALKIDSLRPVLYNNLGSVYAQQGHTDDAIGLFQNAIQLDTTYADAYYNLGNAFSDKKESSKANICYQFAAQYGNQDAAKILEEKNSKSQRKSQISKPDTAASRQ